MIKINKDWILRILLCCLPLLATIQYWFYGNKQIEQACLIATCAVMCVCLCFTFRQTITYKIAATLILCLASILITLVYHKGLGSGLVLISLLLGACIFNNLVVSLTTYRWLHIVTAFLLVGFALTLDYQIVNSAHIPSKYTNIVLNANEIAIIWLAFVAHLLCFTRTFQQTLGLRIFNLAMISVSAYFIYWSDCRSALGSLVIFLVLLFFKENPFPVKHYHYLCRVILIISLVFVIIYLMGYSYLADGQLLGKGLFSGRQFVWRSGLKFISEYPFFGSGNDFVYESVKDVTASSHNMMLGIWKMFGIVPTLAVIFLLTSTHTLNAQLRIEKTAQFAFIASLLIGFFEAFLIGSANYIFFLLFLIYLIKFPKEKKDIQRYETTH